MSKGLRGLESQTVRLQDKEFLITEMTMLQAEKLADIFAKIEVGSLSEFLNLIAESPQKLIKSLSKNKLHRELIKTIISPHGKHTAEDIEWEFLSVKDSVRLVEFFLALNRDWLKDGKKSLKNLMQGVMTILPMMMDSSMKSNGLKESTEQSNKPGEKSKKT